MWHRHKRNSQKLPTLWCTYQKENVRFYQVRDSGSYVAFRCNDNSRQEHPAKPIS